MKIQIEKKDLAKLIGRVAKAAAVTDTVPVLQGLYLEAKEGRLIAKASNMEVSIKDATAEIQLNEEGKCLVNARYLDNFVKQLPESVVSLEVEDNVLHVKYGRNKAKVPLIAGDYLDFPICETLVGTFPAEELKKAISIILPCVAKQHFRAVFTGVLMDFMADKTVVVGSDTHRLATYEIGVGGEPRQLIIPFNGAAEIARIDEEVEIYASENSVLFKAGYLEIYTRLISGLYPDYTKVIPTNFVCEAELPTKKLRQALQRLNTLPAEAKKAIPVVEVQLNGNITLSSTGDSGEINEIIEVEKTGEDLTLSFNRDYLLEAVKGLNFETLKFSFSGKQSPAKIVGNENSQITLVPLFAN